MINEQITEYRLLQIIGHGGFGRVYKGRHIRLENRFVAVKLFMGNVDSEQDRERFLHEARILDQIRHPHILPVLDCGIHQDSGLPYIITEFAGGGSLAGRLQDGLFPVQQSLTILSQVGEALQFAHDHNILHDDLKPENILFTNAGEALLADFGIAVVLQSTLTKHGLFAGTLEYMAPEGFKGDRNAQSDQYSLACLAYKLFTGELPFQVSDPSKRVQLVKMHEDQQPQPPSALNPELPLAVDAVILRALEKDSKDRYPTISTFLQELQQAFQPSYVDISRPFVPRAPVPPSSDLLASLTRIPLLPHNPRVPQRSQRAQRVHRSAVARHRPAPLRGQIVRPRVYAIADDGDDRGFQFVYPGSDESIFDFRWPNSSIKIMRGPSPGYPVTHRSKRARLGDPVPVARRLQPAVRSRRSRPPGSIKIMRGPSLDHPARSQFARWGDIAVSPFLYMVALLSYIFISNRFASWCATVAVLLALAYSLYDPLVHMWHKGFWWRVMSLLVLVDAFGYLLLALPSHSMAPFFLSLSLLVILCSCSRWLSNKK